MIVVYNHRPDPFRCCFYSRIRVRTVRNRNLAKCDIRLLYRHPQYVDVFLHVFYPH